MARYKAGEKEQARERMLEAAGRRLRRSGFHGVGIDGLMAEAGFTSGAFYSNFGSKEGLLEAVLDRAIGSMREFMTTVPEDGLSDFVRDYLSERHRDDIEDGCSMPGLTIDAGRAGEVVRQTYERRVEALIDEIAERTSGADEQERRANAWRVLAYMVGGVAISRALPEGTAATEILQAAADGAAALGRNQKSL